MEDQIAAISGGLSWPLQNSECKAMTSLDTEQQQTYVDMAAEFLWRWTGQVYGTKTVTVSPVAHDFGRGYASTYYGSGPYGRRSFAYPYAGAYAHWYGGAGGDVEVRLTQPLSVEEVNIDGEVLDPSAYHLRGAVLVRSDGLPWPERGVPFTVTYKRGREVPPGGQIAASILACEFAMAANDDPGCSLPSRVQTVTREGVTVAVMDQFEDLKEGHTGIWLIDSWVASVSHAPQNSTVMSPETVRRRR